MPKSPKNLLLKSKYKTKVEEIVESINIAINKNIEIKKEINKFYSSMRNRFTQLLWALDPEQKLPLSPPYSIAELNESYSVQKDPYLDCHPLVLDERLETIKRELIKNLMIEREVLETELHKIKSKFNARIVGLFDEFKTDISELKKSHTSVMTYTYNNHPRSPITQPVVYPTPPNMTNSDDDTLSGKEYKDSPKRSKLGIDI